MRSFGLIALGLSLVLAGILTWLNLSWRTISEFTNQTSQSRIDYYLSDFTLINTNKFGQIVYQLEGEHLIHKQENGASEIYRPSITKSSDKGNRLTINADKAIQISKGGNIELTGKVNVEQKSPDKLLGFKLLTQNLTYNPKEQKISTMEKSDFISTQGSIKGVGFETSLDEQELRILSNVQAEFQPSE